MVSVYIKGGDNATIIVLLVQTHVGSDRNFFTAKHTMSLVDHSHSIKEWVHGVYIKRHANATINL